MRVKEGDFDGDLLDACLTIQQLRPEGSPMDANDSGIGRSPHSSVLGANDTYQGKAYLGHFFLLFRKSPLLILGCGGGGGGGGEGGGVGRRRLGRI